MLRRGTVSMLGLIAATAFAPLCASAQGIERLAPALGLAQSRRAE